MTTNYSFDAPDDTIHKLTATLLLSRYESERILTQGNFTYKVKGGDSGYLYYKKGNSSNWILIAIWCFYGLYIVVHYRKPAWLRPMYKCLFDKMNFVLANFQDYSIELVGSDGQILRGRKFRLSPPSAFDRVMSEKFDFPEEQIQSLKTDVGLD